MTRPGVTYWTASQCDQVVRPGWSFLHHLICHLKGSRHDNHYIRLNKEAREDIQWWLILIGIWNGISIFPVSRPVVDLASMHQGPGDVEPTQTIGGFRWNGQPNVYKKTLLLRNCYQLYWQLQHGDINGATTTFDVFVTMRQLCMFWHRAIQKALT